MRVRVRVRVGLGEGEREDADEEGAMAVLWPVGVLVVLLQQ